MCTVTYIPASKENPFVLTSNRDEKAYRPTLPPAIYTHNSRKVTYPRDEKAGGSWIAINEKGKVACLLNGAFVLHTKQDYHTISRGTVLVDFAASEKNSHEYFSGKELERVEPFTIVSIEYQNNTVLDFTEFIWDGQNKHFRQLNASSPYIWSSVTLYNEEHRNMRKDWFVRFYKETREYITPEKILEFHSGKHTSDDTVNVVMQREGGLKTVSTTQVTAFDMILKMKYTDLVQHSLQEITI
jgi:hypothetical protein